MNFNEYDEETTTRCRRALVTFLGDVGFWHDRVYLVGGLAPGFLVPEASAHVGSADIDVVVSISVDGGPPDTYYTLATNLVRAGFTQSEPSFRWTRNVGNVDVVLELLGESPDGGQPGRVFHPRDERTGSGLSLLHIPGAALVSRDYIEREVEEERLDGGGRSRITVRVANILSLTVLKVRAFQERHKNKDAYDIVFSILNFAEGPEEAGRVAARSEIANDEMVVQALALLGRRFKEVDDDGPAAYANFMAPESRDEDARRRLEAVVAVEQFLQSFATASGREI